MEEKLRRLAECPFSFVKGWAKVLETRAPFHRPELSQKVQPNSTSTRVWTNHSTDHIYVQAHIEQVHSAMPMNKTVIESCSGRLFLYLVL